MVTGYRPSSSGANLREVPSEREIHFVNGTGTLCGARLTEPWTVSEGRVTCDACWSVLIARNLERRESVKQAVHALTTIMRQT